MADADKLSGHDVRQFRQFVPGSPLTNGRNYDAGDYSPRNAENAPSAYPLINPLQLMNKIGNYFNNCPFFRKQFYDETLAETMPQPVFMEQGFYNLPQTWEDGNV